MQGKTHKLMTITFTLTLLTVLLLAQSALAATVMIPSKINVSASSAAPNVPVYWTTSYTAGAAYELEMSINGGAFANIYSGSANSFTKTGLTNGSHVFRVRATKLGMTPSNWKVSVPCNVSLTAGIPSYLNAPTKAAGGYFPVGWGVSQTPGVNYELEVDSGTGFANVYTGTAQQYTFEALTPGTYTFRVRASKSGYNPSNWRVSAACVVTGPAVGGIGTCKYCHAGWPVYNEWRSGTHGNANLTPDLNYFGNDPAVCGACHNTLGEGAAMPSVDGSAARPIVSCESCHGPSDQHGGVPERVTYRVPGYVQCNACHTAKADDHPGEDVGASYLLSGHKNASTHTGQICQRCHTTDGALQGAAAGYTGGYAVMINTANAPAVIAAPKTFIDCTACHDAHTGTLRTITGWNPNQNGSSSDQFDLCTSCHTLYDNTGAPTEFYHRDRAGRSVTDSHHDNPATGVGLASNVVEGYVVRTQSASPCADCHSVHMGDLVIQEAWANSAHAGKISEKKCDASLTWYNGAYPADQAAACTDKTTTTGTRTVLEFAQRNYPVGIAAITNAGALDDADGNAWTHYNWDQTSSRGSCQRCHTATGAMNFLNNPAGYVANGTGNSFSHLSGWSAATGSPQQELLYCWGCHSDTATGTLRNPGAITETYAPATTGDPATTVTYPNVAQSNVCMACHLGREIGTVITNDGDADGVRSFTNSHYLAAGATIFNESGYEYAGQTYNTLGYHKNVGMNVYGTGTAGPCVTCHMTGTETHGFEVLDASGAPATTQCANCHGGLTAPILAESEEAFHTALMALRSALDAKGIYFYPAHPYFYKDSNNNGVFDMGEDINRNGVLDAGEDVNINGILDKGVDNDVTSGASSDAFTNWAGVYGFAKWKDVEGAAFNFNLLDHDPGAYAHNRQYALKLIADSIDFLADGLVDGLGIPTTVTDVIYSTEFAEATSHPAAIVAAPSAVNCGICHSNEPHYGGFAAYSTGGTWGGSSWSGSTSVLGKGQYAYVGAACADCHDGGSTTANPNILVQYAESGHGNTAGDAWIHYNWKWTDASASVVGSSDRSGCVRCHTSTGYKAFVPSNPNFNTYTLVFADNNGDADNPAEVLSCGACHSNLTTGALNNPGAVRPKSTANPPVTLVAKADYDDAAAVAVSDLPDASKSNVCYYCHAGGGNMFSNWSSSRVASHHAVAAGTLNSNVTRLGYELIDTVNTEYLTYAVSPHKGIGIEDPVNPASAGPCVSCHMPGKNHHFESVDNTAYVINAQALCDTCHGAGPAPAITYASLEEEKAGYEAAGVLLTAFINNTVQNYKNAVVTGSVTLHNDRAAWYNFKVFPTEEAGGFVHNPTYVKQLMFDSIDWLQDGVLNGALTTGTGTSQIDPTIHADALAWLGGGVARP